MKIHDDYASWEKEVENHGFYNNKTAQYILPVDASDRTLPKLLSDRGINVDEVHVVWGVNTDDGFPTIHTFEPPTKDGSFDAFKTTVAKWAKLLGTPIPPGGNKP